MPLQNNKEKYHSIIFPLRAQIHRHSLQVGFCHVDVKVQMLYVLPNDGSRPVEDYCRLSDINIKHVFCEMKQT
jgi:hypothetical protein